MAILKGYLASVVVWVVIFLASLFFVWGPLLEHGWRKKGAERKRPTISALTRFLILAFVPVVRALLVIGFFHLAFKENPDREDQPCDPEDCTTCPHPPYSDVEKQKKTSK